MTQPALMRRGASNRLRAAVVLAVGLAIAAGCSRAPSPSDRTGGADATAVAGQTVAPPAADADAMVAAAHPLAVAAGLEILRAGGSAVDAAVAVEATLSLVEPQSSGFAGGGFLVHYDGETRAITVYDGREAAPAAATPDMFLDDSGATLGFRDAWASGLSVGVPGVVDMLALAHSDHGALPWADLLQPAIVLADDGFPVSERLNYLIGLLGFHLKLQPESRAYYFIDDEPLPVGHILKNAAYAATLRALADNPRALHQGPLADAILTAARAEPRPSRLTAVDLAGYNARRTQPICTPYRVWRVCGAPPPASGGLAVGQVLGLLERHDFDAGGPEDLDNWVLFTEAQRLAYADRDRYVADDRYVAVPKAGLLDPRYLAQRAALIDAHGAARETVEPGDPWAFDPNGPAPEPAGADSTADTPGTTHFVIMDAEGDVVSMTATVESPFGSGRMAGGMMLNNELTDFARAPVDAQGRQAANRVEAGKRPRSSMSPTIVLDETGAFVMATGSPGGNSIIAYTAKSLVGVLDWGLTPQDAAELPNVVARGPQVRIEAGHPRSEELAAALTARGFAVAEPSRENSGIHTILRQADGTLVGAADPRREGVVGTP